MLNAAVTLQYISPAIASTSTWSVVLSGLVSETLAPPSVLTQSTPGCTQRHCAKFVINYVVPKDAIPLEGGQVTVTIAVGIDNVKFVMPFDADDTPSVESLDPASMSLVDTSGSGVISMYLKNVPATFCSDAGSCSVTFGGRAGTVVDSSFASKILSLSIRPPAMGAGGSVPGQIADNSVTIGFDYTFTSPPASLEPIDGSCSGGETVTFAVLGWGQVVASVDDVNVVFGGHEGKVSKVVGSVASASYSLTTLEVTTPILSSQGTHNGVVSLSGAKSTSFVFECFNSPIAKATPAASTLDGRVIAASDGKSVTLELSSFPEIETTADVEVRFGDVTCDGSACSVLSFTNAPGTVLLTLIPPTVARSANVMLSAEFQGKAAPPQGGDPSKTYVRSRKIASTAFSFYRPNPVVISARWCRACYDGRTCISGGYCKDKNGAKVRPKLNSFGNTGEGVLTIIAENLPQIAGNMATGEVLAPSEVQVSFGNYFGNLRKLLYSETVRSAFEVTLSSPVAVGTQLMDLKIFEDNAIPVSFSAKADITFFEENIFIGGCDCDAPSTGSAGLSGRRLSFFVENLAVDSASDLLLTFGDTAALDLEMVSSTAKRTFLEATIPACSLCTFSSGVATVELAVAYAFDKVQITSTPFHYFSAPTLTSVRFTTTGTSIVCRFDQATDRAGMTDTDCSRILADSTLAKLGTDAACVWSSDDELQVFFGVDPTIEPNDVLALKEQTLRSLNKKSPHSTASSAVARPLVIKQPDVSVKGVSTIDPCSSLEVLVAVISPRPVSYSWSCVNDAEFNAYLATVSSSTLYMAPGTSQMTTFPKEYILEITVVDFLGVVSVPTRFKVLKKATPTPQVQFNPPSVETLRNKPVLIKGETVFSACPVEETELAFSWRQVSGPVLAPALLSATMPQLFIPANELVPGSIVQVALKASMGDVSQSSESIVLIKVGYQQLVARLSGGKRVSTYSTLELSADKSQDPDLDSSLPQGLTFSWSCGLMEDGFLNTCRDPSGNPVVLPTDSATASTISIAPLVLPPKETLYTFTVVVRKGSRTSYPASMTVLVVPDRVPTVTIQLPGDAIVATDGAMVINSKDRMIFNGLSSSNSTSFLWSMQGANVTMPGVSPMGTRLPIFVFDGAFSQLQGGTRYILKLQGTSASGSIGESTLELVVNSAPLGGSFSVCLLDPTQAEFACIKTGEAVTDDFRLLAASWSDPDLPLMYRFGYMKNQSFISAGDAGVLTAPAASGPNSSANKSNTSQIAEKADQALVEAGEIWFEPVRDNTRDIGFPSGQIILKCRVIDALGAATDVLTDTITVVAGTVAAPGGGRRLLAADDFVTKVNDKLAGALKTFRADKVNQMASAVSIHADGGGLGVADGTSMKGALMSSLSEASGKAVKSTGFACESFGAGKSVTSNAGMLNSKAVGSSASMLQSLVSGGLGSGGMSMACASSAASMMGSSLKAQALFAKQNGGSTGGMVIPLLSSAEAAGFLSSLENGLKEVMRQAIWDAVAGEPPRTSSVEASEHQISRTTLDKVSGTQVSIPMPSLTGITSAAFFSLPATFSTDVFGIETPEVDIHLQVHGGAPSVGSHVVRSALVGMTVSRARSASATPVQNLQQGFNLTIPIDTVQMSMSSRMLLAQQAACVHWNESKYSTEGCNVSEVSLTHVTCSCTHLTLFGLAQDTSIAACGDGVLQEGEGCDDLNIYSSDGCSSTCQLEAAYICEGIPSKCKPNVLVGTTVLNVAGVRATMGLTGFTSKHDFINNQAVFVDSLVTALGSTGQDLDASHVIVVSVCFGNDCTFYYSGRRSLAGITEVDFQVNMPPGADVRKVFAAVSTDDFLATMSMQLTKSLGITVETAYVRSPEEVAEKSHDVNSISNTVLEEKNTTLIESTAAPFQLSLSFVIAFAAACIVITTAMLAYLSWSRRKAMMARYAANTQERKKMAEKLHTGADPQESPSSEQTRSQKHKKFHPQTGALGTEKEEHLRLAREEVELTRLRLENARKEADRVKRKNAELQRRLHLSSEAHDASSGFSFDASGASNTAVVLDLSRSRRKGSGLASDATTAAAGPAGVDGDSLGDDITRLSPQLADMNSPTSQEDEQNLFSSGQGPLFGPHTPPAVPSKLSDPELEKKRRCVFNVFCVYARD